jgi:hypothetical protein
MFKRIMLIGILAFSLMALLAPQVMAWALWGQWGWCHYKATYDIRGGQKPGTLTTFLASDFLVLEGAHVCRNPNRYDVRVGYGGIKLRVVSSGVNWQFDNRGRTEETQKIPASVDFIFNDPLHDCYLDLECAQAAFEKLWGVSRFKDCRNDKWWPYMFLVKRVMLTGRILTDCEYLCLEFDPEHPGDPAYCLDPFLIPCYDDDDNPCFCNEDDWAARSCKCFDENGDPITEPVEFCNCDVSAETSIWCETLEEYRDWPGADDKVYYICVYVGAPIAWDDYYRVKADRTLTVPVPGVLGNDSDYEGDDIKVAEVKDASDVIHSVPLGGYVNFWTDHGYVTMYDDGSFTYTPTNGYTGDDSFFYVVKDIHNNVGNEAEVHITVR